MRSRHLQTHHDRRRRTDPSTRRSSAGHRDPWRASRLRCGGRDPGVYGHSGCCGRDVVVTQTIINRPLPPLQLLRNDAGHRDDNSRSKAQNVRKDGTEIYPEGLYHVLKELHERYGRPIMITENGMPEVSDSQKRATYLVSHLGQLQRAQVFPCSGMCAGLRSTTLWCYHHEPKARFGLFHVDREMADAEGRRTLPRQMTEAALTLQYIIAEGGVGDAAQRLVRSPPKATRRFRRR